MICPNCGAENDNQNTQCILCGYIFEDLLDKDIPTDNNIADNENANNDIPKSKKICPNCGAKNDIENNQCELCGFVFENQQQEDIQTDVNVVKKQISNNEQQLNKQPSKAPIVIISVVCCILLVAVILLAYIFISNNNKDDKSNVVSKSEISSVAETTTTTTITTTTTTEPTTTTTTPTTTITTTTTTAKPEVYAKDLINITKGKLMSKYFDNLYDVGYISVGQENVVALENTGKLPYFKFGFYADMADHISSSDKVCAIHVMPGGKIDSKTRIGMTYNELKKIYHFDGATFDGGTFGATAWITVDGVKWGIEFKLTPQDKAQLGVTDGVPFEMIGVPIDLSDINPTSDLGYYIESLQ